MNELLTSTIPTLQQAEESFIQSIKASKSTETLRGYGIDLKQFRCWLSTDINGPMFVDIISEQHIHDYISYLKFERHICAMSINRKVNAISSMFNYLMRKKIVLDNPAAGVDRLKVTTKERTHLTKDEVDALLQAIDHPIVHYVVVMMLNTGIRIRECVELSLQNVDLTEKIVRVIEGKGGKNRVVPMNDYLVEEMRDYLDNHRPYTTSLNFFATEQSGRISAQYVNVVIKEAVKKAGIQKKVSSHILRHSFASHLVNANVYVATISKLLGHADVRTTSVYMHSTNQQMNDAVNKIDW
ncbi:tyrosine-type recombinase/integrase [Psychrobacillus sp. FSL K6-2843]|uniref:tyrosine-type recombinase/integrase n=1 Tax=Psychrobacillus sp. FSL K6-2843 TaxID=2921549 RepID=UPI00315A03FA